MSTAFRSGIKGTFAIYSDDNDRMMPLPTSLSAVEHRYASPLPIESHLDNGSTCASRETDPLVLVVQLKKELDDERRRFERERCELEAALTAAKGAARGEAEALREAAAAAEASGKRAAEEADAERKRRREAEAEWSSERRALKEEAERTKAEQRAKEEDLQDRLHGEVSAAEAKAAAAAEALRQEHATRRGREAVAEKKFAAMQLQLAAAEEAREALQRSALAEAAQFRRELDEARMRHSDVCQQLVEVDQKCGQLTDDNRLLAEEVDAALAAGEEQRRRVESEWRAHLQAELAHAREEAAEALEAARREHRKEVKALESDYRSRIDEAKQRLVTILRQKKAKYAEQRGELEEKLKKCQQQLKAEQKDAAEVRARLARLLGRASGLIEDHCLSTRRLITDGRESATSIYSATARDDASLMSEVWSLPTAVEMGDSPSVPCALRD